MSRKKQSFLSSIYYSIFWKILEKFFALVKHVFIASAFGLSAQLDIFYLLLAFLGLFIFTWANLIDVIALPKLVHYHNHGQATEFKNLCQLLLFLTFTLSVVICFGVIISNGIWTQLVFGLDSNRYILLRECIYWAIPVMIFYIPMRHLGAILRAKRQFQTFFTAELLISAVVLALVFTCNNVPYVLVWSFSVGVFVAFLFLFAHCYNEFSKIDSYNIAALAPLARILPSLLLLQCATYSFALTDKIFVSVLPTGAVSALAYGLTLATLLPSFLSLSNGFIVVVSESKTVDDKESKFNSLFDVVIWLSGAAVTWLVINNKFIVTALLERGVFSPEDSYLVSSILKVYALLVPVLLLNGPISQLYQVENKISFLTKRMLVGACVNIFLNYLFLYTLDFGIWGVAYATVISYYCILLYGLRGLSQLSYFFQMRDKFYWIMINSLPYLSINFILANLFDQGSTSILGLIISSLMILGVMLSITFLTSCSESTIVRAIIRRSIKRLLNG